MGARPALARGRGATPHRDSCRDPRHPRSRRAAHGAWADVLLVDLDALSVGPTRWVNDLPADSGRLVVDAAGYRAVIVNGEVVLEDGAATGALPGRVLREFA